MHKKEYNKKEAEEAKKEAEKAKKEAEEAKEKHKQAKERHKDAITGSDDIDVRDRREVLESVIQDTRFVIIQAILSHPEQMPSLKEISFVIPEKSEKTIREHLTDLQENDIVEKVSLPKEKQERDLPRKFYAITEYGYKFLQDHCLITSEETLREVYKRTEKPEEIQAYEKASRPSSKHLEINIYKADNEN